MTFLEQLAQLIKSVLSQYSYNFFSESITAIILSIVFVLILIARSELCNYFEARKSVDKTDMLYNLLAEISFPLLYFISLSFISSQFQSVKVSFLIFNSFIYVYFGLILIKYSKHIPTISENKWWIYALNVLIVIASASHLLTNLTANFYNSQILLNVFIFMLENSVKYIFFIIFFRTLSYMFAQNKHRFGFSAVILSSLYPIVYYLYTALFVCLLWLIVIIKFNYSYFVGILSVLIIFTIFMIARRHVFPLFQFKHRENNINSITYDNLYQSLQSVGILGLGWAFYNISLKHFNSEVMINFLKNKHLILTDLVEISYFSLISDAFLFLVLFSLLGLLKNLLSIYESSKTVSSFRTS